MYTSGDEPEVAWQRREPGVDLPVGEMPEEKHRRPMMEWYFL